MIQLDSFTIEEERAIAELKSRVGHELTPKDLADETFFYRFLKARDFNIEDAEKLVRKHISDFKQYNLNDIHINYSEKPGISKYMPSAVLGYDKEGSIVRYIDIGRMDFKGFLAVYQFKDMVRYVIGNLEKDIITLTEQTKKTGKQASQIFVIIDVDTMNFFQVTYKKALDSCYMGFKFLQDNYPERIKLCVMINASYYCTIGLKFIKPILSPALQEKIFLCGKSEVKDFLLDKIDADVLPAFLGGNRTDPDGDPFCTSFITFATKVPDHLIQRNNRRPLSEEPGTKRVKVTRFSSTELTFHVSEATTYLEWEFEMKCRDIAFGLYYRDDCKEKPTVEELIPKQRTDTILAAETGLYKCDKVGTYVIVFDNSHSWIFSKEIYYRVRLIPAKEYEAS